MMTSPRRCYPSDNQHSAKRRCLSSVESRIYHHPLFDEIDAAAENEELVTIHVLNDQSMDIVLSYFNIVQLFRLSLVCRRWYNLSLLKISRIKSFSVVALREQADTFWKSRIKLVKITSIMSVLSVNCGSLTSLSLLDIDGLNAVTFSYLCEFLPNLVNLKVGGSVLSDQTILAVIREKLAPRLESLLMFGRYATKEKVLSNVLKNANRLVHLTLEDWFDERSDSDGSNLPMVLPSTNPIVSVELSCLKLHTDVLGFIMRNFAATLRYLCMSNNDPLSFVDNPTIKSLTRLNNMEILLIDHEKPISSVYEFLPTDYSNRLISVIKLMPNLKIIDLTGHHHFTTTDTDIVGILSNCCLLLEELHLSNCWIPTEKLEKLKGFKCLKRLKLDHHFSEPVESVYGMEPYDTVLAFSFFASRVLPHMKELEYVSLESADFHVDDLVSFVRNAGPKFRGLELFAPDACQPPYPDDLDEIPHNDFEDVLPKCNSISRTEPMTIVIKGLYSLHRNSCKAKSVKPKLLRSHSCSCKDDCYSFYNEMCPDFLHIWDQSDGIHIKNIHFDNNQFVSDNGYLSSEYCRYLNLPIYHELRLFY